MALKDRYYLQGLFRTHPDLTVDAELLNARTSISFDVVHLCTAISHGCSIDSVRTYMEHYRKDNAAFQGMVNQAIPVLYYAIGRNSPEMVSLLLEYGFSPEGCINTTHFIPALAFAVIHGHLQLQDTTEIVKVLLAGGADPKSIPEDMWQRYLEQPSEERPTTVNYTAAFLQWCGKRTRTHLAHGLNLTQRYYLHRANSARPFEPREISEANLHDAEGILKLAYRIIGQLPVLHDLQQQILNQIASNVDNPAALVMVFAGPPGHGKTELATQLGGLLRVPTTTIVCSQMNTDTELLGSRNGYHGSTQGSTLNNHLSDNIGECSVVFLDEFDKSSQAVYNALLTIMSEGEYQDRRQNRMIDCSKIIWVLASNLGDEAITTYYKRHLEHLTDDQKQNVNLTPLLRQLAGIYKGRWGAAFESRIDCIVPFFPFSPGEQAVVAHKFLRANAASVRKDIDLRKEVRRHMGHCHIGLQEDGKLCSHMAERGYDVSSGARGLKQEVRKVQIMARKVYNTIPNLVTESSNNGPLERLEVKLMPTGHKENEVGVILKRD